MLLKNVPMKTIALFWFFLMALSFSGTAQTEKLVAVFADSKKIWIAGDKESVSEFTLKTTPAQLQTIRQNAESMGSGLSIDIQPIEGRDSEYRFQLKVPYRTEVVYLHKLFLFFGITDYSVQGTQRPVSALLNSAGK